MIIFVIGITSWPGTARIIRAQALAVETRPYLERSRALGAGHWHQMSKHVLPNVMPLLLANTILTVAGTILSETTLSFLGLGDPTRPSWGEMLNAAFFTSGVGTGNALWLLAPGVAIILVVMALHAGRPRARSRAQPEAAGALMALYLGGLMAPCSNYATCPSPTRPRAARCPPCAGSA